MKWLSLLVFLIGSSAFAVSVPPTCAGINLSSYMLAGAPENAAPEKIYKFRQLRDRILSSLDDGKESTCLVDFYQKGISEEGEYWGGRLAQAGCKVADSGEISGSCSEASEARKSVQYIGSLDRELRSKLKDKIAAAREARAPAAAVTSGVPQACLAIAKPTAQDTRDAFCCGTKDDNAGMIRAVESKMNYNTCLGKIRPTQENFLSGGGVIDCLGNAIKGAAHVIWDSITSILKLPGELWAARSQIWALITQKEAREKFAAQLLDQFKHFFTDRVDAFSCYNDYEKAQYVCKVGGELIATCALPETFGAFIGLAAKPAMTAAKSIGAILAKSGKGQALLSGMAKANEAASAGLAAVGKTAERAGSAVNRATGGQAGRLANAAGDVLEGANTARRIIGRPLSIVAEKLALKIENSSSFQRMFVSGFKVEQKAMMAAEAAQRPPALQLAEGQAASVQSAENAIAQTAQRAEIATAQTAQRAEAATAQTAQRAEAATAQTAQRAEAATAQTAQRAEAATAQTAQRAEAATAQTQLENQAAQARPVEPAQRSLTGQRAEVAAPPEPIISRPVVEPTPSRSVAEPTPPRPVAEPTPPRSVAEPTPPRPVAEPTPSRPVARPTPEPTVAAPAAEIPITPKVASVAKPATVASDLAGAKPPGKIKTFINKILGRTEKPVPAKVPLREGPDYRAMENEMFGSANRNLRYVERGNAVTSEAANAELLKTMKEWPTDTPNSKRLSGFEDKKINEIFRKVDNDNSTMCSLKNYDPNGNIGFCFGRATRAHIESLKAGISKDQVRKIWAVGDLRTGTVNWDWHVATVVRNEAGQWMAIDPIMHEVITVEQWYARMKKFDHGGNMRIFSSRAERFGPSSNGKYSPGELNHDAYNQYFKDMMEGFSREGAGRRGTSSAPNP